MSKQMFRWSIWFFLGNIVMFWAAGLNYLRSVSWLDSSVLLTKVKIILAAYAAFSYLGQLALLACVPGILIVLIAIIFPWRRLVMCVAVLIASTAVMLIFFDALIYKLYRYHLNGVLLNFIFLSRKQSMFDLSYGEIWQVIFLFSGILCLESLFAFVLWRAIHHEKFSLAKTKWIGVGLVFCVYISYSMVFFNAESAIGRVILDTSRVFPLYTKMLSMMLPYRKAKAGLDRFSETALIQPPQAYSKLQYPLHALQCEPKKQPKNLLVIVIDTWRFDVLNHAVMPYLSEFAKQSWQFTQHFSGGNSTGPGIFSLFYGLPITYWTAMENQHQGPVLIDELIRQHYVTTVFASSTLMSPAFHRTVLQNIPGVRLEQQIGDTPYERDSVVTQNFEHFVQKVKQPFFTFLFYDAAHGFCALKNANKPFQPAIEHCSRSELLTQADPVPYFNRYKNAVFLVDQQIKQVIETLKKRHLLDDTVIVITGDHGEEFNDNHMGYWHHAGNFTRYQVQTPLVVYWPGEKPRVFSHQTSHFDIAPTLMKRLLGCGNSAKDFSLGTQLLDKSIRPYRIVGSYIDFGIVEKNRITTVFPEGDVQIDNLYAKSIPDAKLNVAVMQDVFQDLRRFYVH